MADLLGNLLDQLRKRIRPVCSHMSEAEFNALTQRMAELEVKYMARRDPFERDGTKRSPRD